ncbi:MAG: hypothetical protein ABI672_06010 [Vicinamibacteria bacterium]
MIHTLGPLSICVWADSILPDPATLVSAGLWHIRSLSGQGRPSLRGPAGAPWFNTAEWSGLETDRWSAWIGNHAQTGFIWAGTKMEESEPLSVVMPAALRRAGILDGHGAVIAPDPNRPDDGLFVTGLSGSGKSTLTVSCALGGARFLTDDSVAIGNTGSALTAWPRRSALALTRTMHDALLGPSPTPVKHEKVFFDGKKIFGSRCVPSLTVRAVVFMERDQGGDASSTSAGRVDQMEALRRLLMGHPILALDVAAKTCFPIVRSLASLPGYRLSGGPDLLDPVTACATLSALLPGNSSDAR